MFVFVEEGDLSVPHCLLVQCSLTDWIQFKLTESLGPKQSNRNQVYTQ